MITGTTVADIMVAPHQASQFDLGTLAELEDQIVRIRDLSHDLKVFAYQAMTFTNAMVKDTERAEFLGERSKVCRELKHITGCTVSLKNNVKI